MPSSNILILAAVEAAKSPSPPEAPAPLPPPPCTPPPARPPAARPPSEDPAPPLPPRLSAVPEGWEGLTAPPAEPGRELLPLLLASLDTLRASRFSLLPPGLPPPPPPDLLLPDSLQEGEACGQSA